MTGYQEVVTDPSYAEQIVCFTAPMVGNYGVAADALRVAARRTRAAVVMREARGPGVDGLAARARRRRAHRASTRARSSCTCATAGAMRAIAIARRGVGRRGARRGPRAAARWPAARSPPASRPASRTSSRDAGTARIAVVDYGCKRSILGRLAWAGAAVTVYPHDVDAGRARALRRRPALERPRRPGAARGRGRDGARRCSAACRCFGICLGHQLLALATGHETFKLPFGHRGANHPVLERATGRVLVTSQNHGFAVAPLARRREATHVSLYDGTVEGLDFPELRARSVQFHPEAGPGPHDAWPLLEPLGRGGERLAEAA